VADEQGGAAGGGAAAPPGSALRELAEHAGILPGYHDMAGAWRPTSDAARERLLAALGYRAGDEAEARRSLDEAREAVRARPVARARVAVAGAGARLLTLAVPDAPGGRVEWEAELAREDGARHTAAGGAGLDADGVGVTDVGLDPPPGYHRLRVTVRGPFGERAAEQALVAVPPRCVEPERLLRGASSAGVTASLYAVRTRRNWGAGDLTDLHALAGLAAEHGASFVGVNPLHALRTLGDEPSPYSPVSRRYRHLLYLDVEAVPELAGDAAARALLADPALGAALARLRARDRVDHAGVLAAKRPALEALHRAFRRHAPAHPRRRAYDAYVAREGEALDRFAAFAALDEYFRRQQVWWWPDWPAELRAPDAPAVAEFAAAHAEVVDFHRWCQFELDAQLAAAAAAARARGLAVGLYQDLAVGSSPAGADVWGDQALYAHGVAVGAPPDPLGPEGQNWGLPPWNPRVLAERGYRDWALLVRAAVAHAGALRIDHALGLFRQFWIPDGMSGRDGAYVRFPADALLGVLALESRRAGGGDGALVVGEDLGTVPPDVAPTLARWGVLSSKVLYFEREEGGAFRAPRRYPSAALATVNTHDLAPLAGWWAGRDVELRRAVGQLDDAEAHEARAGRARDRAALVRMLAAEGALAPDVAAAAEARAAARSAVHGDGRTGDAPEGGAATTHAPAGDATTTGGPAPAAPAGLDAGALDADTVIAAVHRALRAAPSCLIGIALEDLVAEVEPVNMPGVGGDKFESWTRRLAVPLEELAADPGLARRFGGPAAWAAAPVTPGREAGAPDPGATAAARDADARDAGAGDGAAGPATAPAVPGVA
jgi:4-alpha-glucanotransferase